MLETQQLSCARGYNRLFEAVNICLQAGQLLRIEGHNGSGKTTLLRTLCGLFPPESGEVLWQGENIHNLAEQYRRDLLYLGHLSGIKGDLTALENLRIHLAMNGQTLADTELMKALDKIGLYGYETVPTRNLSQGQKRRVALARLLLTRARLWILDEPFVALDKAAVANLQTLLVQHLENKGMVVLTTHQDVPFDEAQSFSLQLGV